MVNLLVLLPVLSITYTCISASNLVIPPQVHADSKEALPPENVPGEAQVVVAKVVQHSPEDNSKQKQVAKNEPPVEPPKDPPKHIEKTKNAKIIAHDASSSSTSTNKSVEKIKNTFNRQDIVQSGALLRGFYVFVGLSVVIMIYFVLRSYRLRKGSQPSSTVRKYGVTARRTDMEMRPLELEDEDDDTLFEINNHNAAR